MNKTTIEYYNDNAELYSSSTYEVDFTQTQERFARYLKSGSKILDFGCGAGRDTKYFLEKGYCVDAIDGSKELCEIASNNIGIEVKHQLFQELTDIEKYDGIWACASILHLSFQELKDVMKKICIALRQNGFLYTSFKYSEFEGMRNGRYFNDMTEDKLEKLLTEIKVFEIKECWITTDVRPGRDDEKWLNLILQKKLI